MGLRSAGHAWSRFLARIPPGRRRWGVAVIIGWWLSPLTAWNDSFTNIPLAIGIAALLRATGVPVRTDVASVGAYIFTNVLGLVLLWLGAGKLTLGPRKAERRRRPGWALRMAARILLYAALVWATVWSIGRMASGP